MKFQGQLIQVFKYLNRFNNVSPRGFFDYDFNDRIEIMVKINSEVIQLISGSVFSSDQNHNNLECPTQQCS